MKKRNVLSRRSNVRRMKRDQPGAAISVIGLLVLYARDRIKMCLIKSSPLRVPLQFCYINLLLKRPDYMIRDLTMLGAFVNSILSTLEQHFLARDISSFSSDLLVFLGIILWGNCSRCRNVGLVSRVLIYQCGHWHDGCSEKEFMAINKPYLRPNVQNLIHENNKMFDAYTAQFLRSMLFHCLSMKAIAERRRETLHKLIQHDI